ncbi:MAG: hypothetical protein IJD39_07005 [Clostridia bacterium]|nr:hypothetical protein [Clostridia bacterium]
MLKVEKPFDVLSFFINSVLDLQTGEMILPIDYDTVPLHYPDAAYSSPENKIQVPRLNPLRMELEICNGGIFDFTPLFQKGLQLIPSVLEPIFLPPHLAYDNSYHRERSSMLFDFFSYVDNVLLAEEIWYDYSEQWAECVMECWARKHHFELLEHPWKLEEEYAQKRAIWQEKMKKEHPDIILDHYFIVNQDEVNCFPDIYMSPIHIVKK